MGLSEYQKKRNFKETAEPHTGKKKPDGQLRFIVQRHHASRLHYDFRLEMDGVLKSWAVPKGPSLNPADKRLAMMVEDHPYDYRTFEGVIPEGNYGAGVVSIFDEGTYEPLSGKGENELKKGLKSGNLKFKLNGGKLKGEFALVKLKNAEDNSWLLIKHKDEFALSKQFDAEDLVSPKIKKQDLEHKKLAANAKEKSKPEPESNPNSDLTFDDFKWMQATPSDKISNGNLWLYEPKLEGLRVIAFTGINGKIKAESGVDVDKKYKAIRGVLGDLEEGTAFDGVISSNGTETLVVFDLLCLKGHDTRNLELQKRKHLLSALIGNIDNPHIKAVDYSESARTDLLKTTKHKNQKGIIAKNATSKYDPIMKDSWRVVTTEKKASPSPSKNITKREAFPAEFPDDVEEDFGKKKLKLTNLNKLYWKTEKIKKGTLLEYYRAISDYILPYLKDRALSLNRHPNGIDAPNFFQKDLDTDQIPDWIKSEPLHSESNNKDIDYLICNDLPTLLWMVNLGCIEINPWLSTYKKPENPVFAVLDLDPNYVDDFTEVVRVALTAKEILERIGIRPYIKTSGSRGLHIFIHVGAKYDFEIVKNFVQYLGKLIMEQHPDTTSLERSPSKRKNKIYLDFLQNRRGQTIAAPYSARPKSGATVSTPLEWDEVNQSLDIKSFTIFNTLNRLDQVGDLWKDIYNEKADLKRALERIGNIDKQENVQ